MSNMWQMVGTLNLNTNKMSQTGEKKQDNNGDLVPLIWLIEKLRRKEGGCTMNELIAEVKKNFEGVEQLKEIKDLAYFKANAEEDYRQVPISVLKYITELEKTLEK
jgi:hypothetical protein